MEKYGPVLGASLFMQTEPFLAGPDFFDLSKHLMWEPGQDAFDAGAIGFAAAARDTAMAISTPAAFDSRFGSPPKIDTAAGALFLGPRSADAGSAAEARVREGSARYLQ